MKLRFDHYLSVGLISLGLVLSYPRKPLALNPTLQDSSALELRTVAPIPVLKTQLSDATATSSTEVLARESEPFLATISARTVYVIDVPSASVLLAKEADALRYPASTTKLMTALVARQLFGLDELVTVDAQTPADGTVVGFRPGEVVPVRDLLSAMLIQSANDAAEILAAHHLEGRPGFLATMNQKAVELHLDHTTFTNPSGIDTLGHQSSARDLALLSREVMKDQLLAEIVRTKTESIQDQASDSAHLLVNTNALLSRDLGVIGVKTGTTELAGEVLITQLQHESRELLIVVLGSQDRYADTLKIMNWVFTHYDWIDPNSGTLEAR